MYAYTACQLAHALNVRLDLLLTGDGPKERTHQDATSQ
jgi:hypothetical protein